MLVVLGQFWKDFVGLGAIQSDVYIPNQNGDECLSSPTCTAGSYIFTGTIHIPLKAFITGEDMKNPKPMVKVGNDGGQGTVEILDMLFTSTGSLPGLVLMGWNVAAEEQGSVAMFDAHFRGGGAYGSKLTLADCPKVTSIPSACVAASMLFHVTPKANDYFREQLGLGG